MVNATQAREFGINGKPVRDIDHGRPHELTSPHQHVFKPNATGGTPGRVKAEPLLEWNYL